jgi:hypothetical protein
MQALFLGFLVLALGFVFAYAMTRAQHNRLLRPFVAAFGILLLAIAVLMLSRGLARYAFPAAIAGLWLVVRFWGNPGRGVLEGAELGKGGTSRVVTDFLEMELDQASGATRGRVVKGIFAGREIADMSPAELAQLWQHCRFADPQSSQVIEAYLDRFHPTWREDMARAEQETRTSGDLSVEEALEILGLKKGASVEDIHRAHRDLIKKFHPDRGGSAYLAAKINDAKDLLLDQAGRK